jgi:MerR family transcriptional regulator, thiopeptide resistance regulator
VEVGELARASGLSVRALHHYDALGLVVPSARTPSGHRLYAEADLRRLYRVIALRGIGLSLAGIAGVLGDNGGDPRVTLRRHLDHVEQQLTDMAQPCERLRGVLVALERAAEPSAADFLDLIERTVMIEQYYTPEQLDQLARRRAELGDDTVREAEAEWPRLYAQADVFAAEGRDPADPQVQAVLTRMDELVAAFHGGDPGLRASLERLWAEQGDALRAQHGPTPEVQAYLDRARTARS